MNTKSKVLIGLMAVCLLGTVGSALALAKNDASATGTPGAFDKAVYLYWGHEATTAEIADVENLQPSTPQYRYLEVSPQSTKTVAGNVTLTFTLAQTAGEHHLQGLTISVYKTESLATDGTVAGLIEGKSAAPVLNASNLSGQTSFAVAADAAAHETKAYYAIEISWSGANDQTEGHEEYTMSGSLTIAQAFGA